MAVLVLLLLSSLSLFAGSAESYFSEHQTLQLVLSPDGNRWAELSTKGRGQVLKLGCVGDASKVLVMDRSAVHFFQWLDNQRGIAQVQTSAVPEIWIIDFRDSGVHSIREKIALSSGERLVGFDSAGIYLMRRISNVAEELIWHSIETSRENTIARVPSGVENVLPHSDFALVHSVEPDGSSLIWKATADGDLPLVRLGPEKFIKTVKIDQDGKDAWILTNQHGDLTELCRISLSDGQTLERIADPTDQSDVVQLLFSHGGEKLLFASFAYPESKPIWLNAEWPEALKAIAGFDHWTPLDISKGNTASFRAVDEHGTLTS